MYLPTPAGPKALGSVMVGAQLMYIYRENLTHPSWVRHTAQLYTACASYVQWSWCSALRICDSALLWAGHFGRTGIQHLDKCVQSVLRAAQRGRFPAINHGAVSTPGELAGLLNIPGSNAFGTQAQLCVSSTRKIQLPKFSACIERDCVHKV